MWGVKRWWSRLSGKRKTNAKKLARCHDGRVIEAFDEEAIKESRTSSRSLLATHLLILNLANFTSFEIDDEVLSNLTEYSLANSLFWALAEGHACEQSARRNAMDNASKNAGDMINK